MPNRQLGTVLHGPQHPYICANLRELDSILARFKNNDIQLKKELVASFVEVINFGPNPS